MTSQENKLIEVTNNNLIDWYKTAKEDYNVDGFGKASIENEKFIVNYTENGVEKQWSMYYHGSYISENGMDWFYRVWSEEAGR